MAKYRKASEKTISRGKGKSTDQLSLADAKEYFNSRAKETGAKRFRWNGDVYDLSGNKISEPARSSGGNSRASTKDDGPKRPKARQMGRGDGAAETSRRASDRGPSFENKGRGNASAASDKPKETAAGGKASPAAVAAMGAGAVAAGVAAARSGRGPGTGRSKNANAPSRLALPAPNRGGTIIPEPQKLKALPKPEDKPKVRSGTGRGGGGRGTGVRVVGGNPVRRAIGAGAAGRNMRDMRFDPLFLNMNKGGLVKKKK